MADLVGYKVNKPVFCDLCGARRDGGGFAVRQPVTGIFCSAAHARVAVEKKEKGDKQDENKVSLTNPKR